MVSALFSEKSLSLFDEKAKKLSVKLYNKDKDWKENGQYFFEIAEELDKEGFYISAASSLFNV